MHWIIIWFILLSLELETWLKLCICRCLLVRRWGTRPEEHLASLIALTFAGSRFLAMLSVRTGDSTFSIVETNQFKHLSHLSLCFRQGNDTVIKSYLAARLAEYKVLDPSRSARTIYWGSHPPLEEYAKVQLTCDICFCIMLLLLLWLGSCSEKLVKNQVRTSINAHYLEAFACLDIGL